MKWDYVAGNWRQLKGSVRERLGKFTDDELIIRNARRDQLLGQIQIRFGIKPDEAKKELQDWGVLK
jgi:uncharacterized protein YjbJ (UPF0337 family)